jgi:hypothetical protein
MLHLVTINLLHCCADPRLATPSPARRQSRFPENKLSARVPFSPSHIGRAHLTLAHKAGAQLRTGALYFFLVATTAASAAATELTGASDQDFDPLKGQARSTLQPCSCHRLSMSVFTFHSSGL